MTHTLIEITDAYRSTVSDEPGNRVAELATATDSASRIGTLEFLMSLADAARRTKTTANEYYDVWAKEQITRYARHVSAEAAASGKFREQALFKGAISLDEALAMPGGLSEVADYLCWNLYPKVVEPFLKNDGTALARNEAGELASIGRYLAAHPSPPPTFSPRQPEVRPEMTRLLIAPEGLRSLDELSGLGFAAVLAVRSEAKAGRARVDLSGIPMPPDFRQRFRDWAEGRVDLAEIIDE